MDQINTDLTNLLRPDVAPVQVLLSSLLAFGMAFLWATVYRWTHSGIAYTRAFYSSLILIAPIVAMIMMAIGSNVALSLGLVGALSIIRFRTVVRDTKDMTFLFMSVGIGLCAGAGAWLIGLIGTGVVAAAAVGLSRAGHDGVGSADYILVFRSESPEPWAQFSEEAHAFIAWHQLRGATTLKAGQTEFTYSIRLAPRAQPEQVVATLRGDLVHDLTLIVPENHLEL